MHGNVWEWVDDCWHESYQGALTDGRAWRTGDDSLRVLRGGNWYLSPKYLRSADRYKASTAGRNFGIGFRVARTLR